MYNYIDFNYVTHKCTDEYAIASHVKDDIHAYISSLIGSGTTSTIYDYCGDCGDLDGFFLSETWPKSAFGLLLTVEIDDDTGDIHVSSDMHRMTNYGSYFAYPFYSEDDPYYNDWSVVGWIDATVTESDLIDMAANHDEEYDEDDDDQRNRLYRAARKNAVKSSIDTLKECKTFDDLEASNAFHLDIDDIVQLVIEEIEKQNTDEAA